MKFKKFMAVVAFGLFSLGLNGLVVNAMDLNEKNDSLAEKLDYLKSSSNSDNMSQRSGETLVKTLDVDRDEFNKIKEAGKVTDSESNLEKSSDLFDSDSFNNMLNRKRKLDKSEDFKNSIKIESNKNKIDEKSSYDDFKFKKPYEPTSSKAFSDLKNEYSSNFNIMRSGLSMTDMSEYGMDVDILDSLKLNCPSAFKYYSEIIKTFESKENKSLDEIKAIVGNSQGKIKELIEKDLIGCKKDENESNKDTALRLDNNFSDSFRLKIDGLKSNFKKVKESCYSELSGFISDLKDIVELNGEFDDNLFLGKDSEKNILEKLEKCLYEYKKELFAEEFDLAKFKIARDDLFKTSNRAIEKMKLYCEGSGFFWSDSSELSSNYNKELEKVTDNCYGKFKRFVKKLEEEINNLVFDDGGDSNLKNKKLEILEKLNECLEKYEQERSEVADLIKTIGTAIDQLYNTMKSSHVSSSSLKQKTSDFLESFKKQSIAKLKCELIEIAIKERFGENALEYLRKIKFCVDC